MGTVDLARELDRLALQPGDVITTGNRDPVSMAIQRATDSQVSHVMVSVGDGMIIESTEYRNLADDRHGGIYLRPLVEVLAGKYVDHIVIRRPVEVRHDRVIASAQRFLADQPVFSSSGVVFTGALVALGQFWTEHVADLILGDERSTALERHFVQLVADGTKRVICAELAYRLLHDADVPLTHDALFLQDAIRHVAPMAAHVPIAAELSTQLAARDRLILALQQADRDPEPPDSVSAIDRLGWPTFLRLTGRHLREAYERRRVEIDDGDVADLITPRDFLEMQPFSDLVVLRLVDDRWRSID